jgi:lipopolysaccharide/colanic/teichoic acid biosynthesis glycosyltransferase
MKIFSFFIKRLGDVFFSGLGLILLIPIFLIIGLIIKLSMPGPIFFLQERVGKNKKNFKIIKFRTMKLDKEAESKIDTSKDLERTTRFGKIMRRTKIDELPQLFNVIKGDMSLVGPRPTIKRQVDKYNEYEAKRLIMKPGMTGLSQVNGGTALPWKERIELDIKYVENFTVLLDIKIFLKTIGVIIFGEDKYKKN